MGLIKAGLGAVGGVLGDQWKEFIYCESMKPDVLVAKGMKRTSSQGRSSNTSAEDNIISNGSTIAINDGQCMIIVENGKVVEICSEPGEYTYDTSTEPSIMAEGLNMDSVKKVFAQIGKRFTYGGDPGKDQRVYFFNTKEIIGNKYGTASPIPFRVVDARIGLDMDIPIRCFGEYSYKITNPILFYTNVCGNVSDEYQRSEIDGQLKTELLTGLNQAFGVMSEKGVRYSALPGHAQEIGDELNKVLSQKWRDLRGVEVVSFGVSSVKASEEDEKYIRDLQALSNPNARVAFMTGATGQAMQSAAANEGAGAMGAFMGMNMAGAAGGNMMGALNQQMAMQQQAQQYAPQQGAGVGAAAPAPQAAAPGADSWKCACGAVNTGKFCAECGAKKPEPKPAEGSWKCACGAVNTGKFCSECGAPKPAAPADNNWTCACGTVNTGKFCSNCGSKKPEAAPVYKCDKCGWVPDDPHNPPKFCPECGDIFDDNDKQ